jgi:uncharacterized protein YjiS (DUF1127 family)
VPQHATAAHCAGHSPAFADAGTPSIWAALRDIIARQRERRRQHRDARDLRFLSDHVLRDIGIGRSEITFITQAGRGER